MQTNSVEIAAVLGALGLLGDIPTSHRGPIPNKYRPHQGEKERARRRRQIARGQLDFSASGQELKDVSTRTA